MRNIALIFSSILALVCAGYGYAGPLNSINSPQYSQFSESNLLHNHNIAPVMKLNLVSNKKDAVEGRKCEYASKADCEAHNLGGTCYFVNGCWFPDSAN